MDTIHTETDIKAKSQSAIDAAAEYWADAWQRSFLTLEALNERGNIHLAQAAKEVPNVLNFGSELVLDGRKLERPVNYELVSIVPPDGAAIDPLKPPIVVVDPRAGHGPGIGGMKPDSEIGVAIRAGHPCYFIGFSPEPMPGQTIEDVCRAEAALYRRGRPPPSRGREQAHCHRQLPGRLADHDDGGDPPGPHGPDPGCGVAAFLLGWRPRQEPDALSGRAARRLLADRAFRRHRRRQVRRREPRREFRARQPRQHLLDQAVQRLLQGRHGEGALSLVRDVVGQSGSDNAGEMQWIVDNLFVGNKLSTGQIRTTDGLRVDLRNIKSPIVVFCSWGDNVTPPQQALDWILDLYDSVDEISPTVRPSFTRCTTAIGHLGIFVSGKIALKEYQEFVSCMDMIEATPPGLYEATIADVTKRTRTASLSTASIFSGSRAGRSTTSALSASIVPTTRSASPQSRVFPRSISASIEPSRSPGFAP